MSTSNVNVPRSGFFTSQFWLGLLGILAAFVLQSFNITLPKEISDFFPVWINEHGSTVAVLLIVGVVAAYIAILSFIQSHTMRNKGIDKIPGKPVRKGGKLFYQTSEFWLGLVTIGLGYLETNNVLPFVTDAGNAHDTGALMIALIYTFARSQLKQAYMTAQADNEKVDAAATASTTSSSAPSASR
jgi:hypothetical protein